MLIKRVPAAYVIKSIKYDLLYVIIVGSVVNFLKYALDNLIPVMPLSIPIFMGTAISILLSFKISQSYERWWEARKIWGAIVNDSRSFVIQLQTFLPLSDTAIVKRLGYRQIAWCYTLGQSLRGLDPYTNTDGLLTEEDVNVLEKHANKALAITQLNAYEIRKYRDNNTISDITHMHLDSTLVRLVESMGMAERINNTVFPTTYRMFLYLAIYLFVTTLSIALKDIDIIYELPLLVVISLVFFLLEKTAVFLQDPFRNSSSDTSVTAIARTIEINLKQLLNDEEENIPEPLQPEGYYIM